MENALQNINITSQKPIVQIAGLYKSFGDNQVLKGIDLNIQAGEVIAIIGKSGSGKSTLLRCINGLESFDSGTLTPGSSFQYLFSSNLQLSPTPYDWAEYYACARPS